MYQWRLLWLFMKYFLKKMYKKIAIIAAKNNPQAINIKNSLVNKYNFFDLSNDHSKLENIDLIIAIGGDGLILHLLHEFENKPIPIYGINCGTVGFLMNSYHEENFLEYVHKAQISMVHPLKMDTIDAENKVYSHIAINEVALFRQTNQAAKINIHINDKERIECLVSDGILVATSAGSTAYNLSVGGPIIPFGAEIIALTPISPFRPRKWNGALLPANSKIKFKIIDFENRPVSATADSREVRNVKEVVVSENLSMRFKILFDQNHSLEERIIREQFLV